MKLRFVLALLVALSVAGASWVSATYKVEAVQIGMAVLLAVLGFAALITLNNSRKAFRLLPLYFAASVLFSVYADLQSTGGVETMALFVISVVGFLTSIAVAMKAGKCGSAKKSKASTKNGSKANRKSSAKTAAKKTRKKPGRRKKKKSSKN